MCTTLSVTRRCPNLKASLCNLCVPLRLCGELSVKTSTAETPRTQRAAETRNCTTTGENLVVDLCTGAGYGYSSNSPRPVFPRIEKLSACTEFRGFLWLYYASSHLCLLRSVLSG